MIAKTSNIFPCWLAIRSQKYECSLIKISKLWFQTKEKLLFIQWRVTTFLLWPRNYRCIGKSKDGWYMKLTLKVLTSPVMSLLWALTSTLGSRLTGGWEDQWAFSQFAGNTKKTVQALEDFCFKALRPPPGSSVICNRSKIIKAQECE